MAQEKKVLMVIAPKNFRDEELLEPKRILENAGAHVTVASKGVKTASGMLGAKVNVDADVSEVDASDYDAVVFVGGGGASAYFKDRQALDIARKSAGAGKITAAICIAPSILANAGLLRGKNATSFPSEEGNLKANGAIYLDRSVVEDGLIVTASGPSAAAEFGRRIAEKMV